MNRKVLIGIIVGAVLIAMMIGILIGTMMIPGAIMMVPSFSMYDTLGWLDTPLPLIIPGLFSSAACVFFMRQFFTGIPDSILEAAKLDGLGLVGIFIKMMSIKGVTLLLLKD